MKFARLIFVPILLSIPAIFHQPVPAAGAANQVSVRIVSDEADAVLAILAKKKGNEAVTETDWQRLFTSEGYTRLKSRELSLERPFADSQFEAFVLSDELAARAPALGDTLNRWKHADATAAARRSLAYLPHGARISAKIYPVIKPQTNSFVFEVKSDPAIFLYLDPEVTKEQFENTLTHELHHIGYGGGCEKRKAARDPSKSPQDVENLIDWIGAFGEGFAMLAAAGGPEVHPHAVSKPEDRARWDRDMANFNDDLKKVEAFFTDILNHRLTEADRNKAGFAFFGVQGPWYTVGWKMSVMIEKTYGRARLIQCICDQSQLLPTYNRAAAKYNRTAKEPLALWSSSLVDTIAGVGRVKRKSWQAAEKLILATETRRHRERRRQ